MNQTPALSDLSHLVLHQQPNLSSLCSCYPFSKILQLTYITYITTFLYTLLMLSTCSSMMIRLKNVLLAFLVDMEETERLLASYEAEIQNLLFS